MSDSGTDKVNLSEKLQQFTERWSPRIVGELNGQHVKLAILEGEFVWHHQREDELFLVLRGHLPSTFAIALLNSTKASSSSFLVESSTSL